MNKIRIAGAAAGVVLVSGMVLQVSSAAFTDTHENAGNTWEAGSVYLDGTATAMFSSTSENIVPGYDETKCIEVTYNGTVDPSAAVTLTVDLTTNQADAAGGDGLGDDLDLVLDVGPAGSTCAGMVDPVLGTALSLVGTQNVFTGTLVDFESSGAETTTWTPGGEAGTDLMRPFRFSVEMPDDVTTPDDAQGDSAVATFIWTASS